MKPTLYLMVGYPGAGKTTIARIIKEKTGAEHVWADYERKIMFGDTYDRSESSMLYDLLNKKMASTLEAGKSVIFDTNFNYASDRLAMRQIAAKTGANTQIVWITTPKETAKSRAVDSDKEDSNRVFAMSGDDFEYIAGHFQEPTYEEKPVNIDGLAKVDVEDIIRQLDLCSLTV